jgi:hypothetical protein
MKQPPQAPNAKKPMNAVYIQEGIPAELPNDNNGRVLGVFSIIFAVISLLFYPIIFGPVGIAFGVMAKNRKSVKLGIVGIILSIVFSIMGVIIALTYEELESAGNILSAFF